MTNKNNSANNKDRVQNRVDAIKRWLVQNPEHEALKEDRGYIRFYFNVDKVSITAGSTVEQ